MSLNNKQLAVIQAVNVLQKLERLEKLEKEENKEKRRIKVNRRFWVNPFLLKRDKYDIESNLLKDLLWEQGSDFQNFCRIHITKFEEILALVEGKIEKKNTAMRYAISPRAKLATTLRYIATGDSYRSLEYLTRISRKTISVFIPQVLTAIYEALQPMYLKMPTTEQEWQKVADDFNNIWDFPHTLGALDGKHIRITAPPQSGSDFYNYKGFFSTVLLAVVDAHSKFLYIDVGGNGRASDNVIFKSSSLYQRLQNNQLKIPPPKELKGQFSKTPYFFIGDDIFGLDKNLMKGYGRNLKLSVQEEIFNYRLSRGRINVETAFGRFAQRFRIFWRPIEVSVPTVDLIVKACCVLHNFLTEDIEKAPTIHEQMEKLPETITGLCVQELDRYKYACRIRNDICKYLVTDGDVLYQWEKINKNIQLYLHCFILRRYKLVFSRPYSLKSSIVCSKRRKGCI